MSEHSHEASSRAHEGGGFPAPERPPLPKPERVNRNALTIVAVVMGVLVVAAVVFVQPTRPAARGAAATPVRPSDPPPSTFLDQPAREEVPSGRSTSDADVRTGAGALDADAGRTGSSDAGNGAYEGGGLPASAPRSPSPSARDRRVEAFAAALSAPVVATQQPRGDGGDTMSADPGGAWEQSAQVVNPAIVSESRTQRPIPSAEVTSGSGGRYDRYLADAARPSPTAIHTSIVPSPGPYAIQAGTVIPAVLVTEINSDLPGEVLAQVSRDVFDSQSQRSLLLPRGSKLLGKYQDQVGAGQNRLLVAWTRVIFPDGRSITLPGLQAKDQAGAGGIGGQVDNHTRQVFGTATLLSLIGAGLQLSQSRGGYGAFGAYPSPGQVVAGAVGQELAAVATQVLRRNLDVQPTIRIRQGTAFNVFLNTDLVFPSPFPE